MLTEDSGLFSRWLKLPHQRSKAEKVDRGAGTIAKCFVVQVEVVVLVIASAIF